VFNKPTAREAVYVDAGEGRPLVRGWVPEDTTSVYAGKNAAGGDRVVLGTLLLDGDLQVREGAAQLCDGSLVLPWAATPPTVVEKAGGD
jgi:hypothetical protein